jgi:hypothetical protein
MCLGWSRQRNAVKKIDIPLAIFFDINKALQRARDCMAAGKIEEAFSLYARINTELYRKSLAGTAPEELVLLLAIRAEWANHRKQAQRRQDSASSLKDDFQPESSNPSTASRCKR